MRNTHVSPGVFSTGKRIGAAIVAAATLLLASACGTAQEGGSEEDKVNVVVSINQWKSLASQIGGDKVSVTSILSNQNVEAHDFEPQPSDIAKISKAQVVVANGADYDAWATKSAKTSQVPVVDAATAADIKSGENPHLWFSATARQKTAEAYLEQLKKLDSANASYFEKQYETWKQKEDALESTISTAKAKLSGTTYAATESVAYYLAQDLGLEEVTPAGYAQAIENESEAAPGDIKAFQEKLESGSVGLLVVNDQETSSTTDMIVKAAKEGGVRIVHLSESMPSKYVDLTEWMDDLVKQFAQ